MTAGMILLTGGTGKTGARIARRLAGRGGAARIASRGGGSVTGEQSVRFDWSNLTGYDAALRDVSAVYLVAPSNAPDPLDAMLPFLRRALYAGVRRFVLLSASSLEEGGPMMGQVHAWLRAEASEWAVLRPTWFMQNFSEQQHLPTLRDEGAIYTAAGDGRVPFIDADDIAASAVALLLAAEPPNRDVLLTGPHALSYDEVARIIATAAGRPMRHIRLDEGELARRWAAHGLTPEYARVLAAMDTAIAHGSEDRVSDAVLALTGRSPRSLESFAAENAALWRPGV